MADFGFAGPPVALMADLAANEVSGVAASPDGASVMLTLQSAGLYRQTLGDQRTTANLSIPTSRGFGCGAAIDPTSHVLYAVATTPRELLVWSDPDLNCGFDEVADKVSLEGSGGGGARGGGAPGIHCLHTCPVFEGVAVVYADGRVSAFQYTAESGLLPKKPELHGSTPPSPSYPLPTTASSSPASSSNSKTKTKTKAKAPSSSSTASVVWSTVVFDQKRGTARLLVLTATAPSGETVLSSFQLGATSDGPTVVHEKSLAVELPPASAQQQQQQQPAALSACFQWPKTLYTMWPGGEVVAHDVGRGGELLAKPAAGSDDSEPEPLKGKLVVAVAAVALKSASASKKRTKSSASAGGAEAGIVLEAFNSSHILMVGVDSGSARPVALLWNTTFSSLTARIHLDANESGERAKIGTILSAVRMSASCIVVAAKHAVVALSVQDKAATGTLAAALGSMAVTKEALTDACLEDLANPIFAHTPADLTGFATVAPAGEAAGWFGAAMERDAELDELGAVLTKPSKVSTLSKFNEAFTAYLKACMLKKKRLGRQPRGTTAGPKLSSEMAVAIVKACLKEKRYFPEDALVQLVKLHCLTYQQCPELYEAAQKAKRQTLLHACTLHLDGIEEAAVVKCAAGLYARDKLASTQPDPANLGNHSEFYAFLRHVFSRTWDESKLVVALQTVSIDAAVGIVQGIRMWLELHADNQRDALCMVGAVHGPVPTLAQVVMWLGFVIDSLFTVLVLAEESHTLLDAINDIIIGHTELCKQFRDQLGLLPYFFARKQLPGSHAEIGPYTIEYIEL